MSLLHSPIGEAMKIMKTIATCSMGIAILFALHQLTNILFVAHGWKGLGPSDWASWVQAVGSIAAIYGAFQISNKQHLRERRLQKEKDQLDEERRYKIIGGILRRIGARLSAVEQHRELSVIQSADDWSIEKLRATVALLDALLSFEMPGPKILILCLSIRSHIVDAADALLAERAARLNVRTYTPQSPTAKGEIEALTSALELAIQICANSASRLD